MWVLYADAHDARCLLRLKGWIIFVALNSKSHGVKFYCEMDDNTDYCPHTAFAAALPQVRNAIKR